MTIEERAKEFLDELTKLSRKYGIVICGCGCCGSPWLDLATRTNHKYITDSSLEKLVWEYVDE